MSELPPPPPPPTGEGNRLGTVGQRALALVLDNIILGVPVVALFLILGVDFTNTNDSAFFAITVVQLVVSLVYNTAMIATSGATVGKRIMRLRVVNRVDGSSVSWSYAAVRALVPTVAGLIPVVGFALNIAVYVRAFFHPYRQGLHDAAAGTIVVRRD